jgi:hypothetical protein
MSRENVEPDDAMRLLYLKQLMDGVGPYDFHEMASISATAAGREEPSDADYLTAIRATLDGVMRASIIDECRAACMAVGSHAAEAAKAKDATDYIAGYQDAAVDCDEALRELANK